MLRLDMLSEERLQAIAGSLPQGIFHRPVGFFESFRLWDLDLHDWPGTTEELQSRAERTEDFLHLLCVFHDDASPGAPVGHAVSGLTDGDEERRFLEIHPGSLLSRSLEEWLASAQSWEGEWSATMFRVEALNVYLLAAGRETDRDEGMVLAPETITLLHSRTVFPSGPGRFVDDLASFGEILRQVPPGILWSGEGAG